MNNYHKTGDDIHKEHAQVEAAKINPQGFSVLYDRYYKQLFVFIYRRMGDEQLTADIVSHVFLIALLKIKKYEFRGVPFSAWLFRIALNEINMYFRKSKLQRLVSLEEADVGRIFEETAIEDVGDEKRILLLALSGLSPDAMQLIELRFFEKRSFGEIGNILGITENNAKVKVYRVLDKLRHRILKYTR